MKSSSHEFDRRVEIIDDFVCLRPVERGDTAEINMFLRSSILPFLSTAKSPIFYRLLFNRTSYQVCIPLSYLIANRININFLVTLMKTFRLIAFLGMLVPMIVATALCYDEKDSTTCWGKRHGSQII